MKRIYLFILFLLPIAALLIIGGGAVHAQELPTAHRLPGITDSLTLLPKVSMQPFENRGSEIARLSSIDTSAKNSYGDLLNDNPAWTPREAWYLPALHIVVQGIILNTFDHYILNLEFARVGFNSWSRNLKASMPWGSGWIWDEDRFGNNFFFHPYTGVGYFNSARVAGYNYWESLPFVFVGSYAWKIFGENGIPEREDLINTTLGGMFGGEIVYRLSSNILDDRSSGEERFAREIAAGIVNPPRFSHRLLTGRLGRVSEVEEYQKEPLNVILSAGEHKVNDGTFWSGMTNITLNMQLDYGDPFEDIARKPFDVFRVRSDLTIGAGRKIIDNVGGYGILFGTNHNSDKLGMLVGGFQYYDYWDNSTFELLTLGLGGGVITKYPISSNANLFTALHLALVPFGGNSTQFGPDVETQQRDYNFGGGLEGKLESTLNFGNHASAALTAYYCWFHTYIGRDIGPNTGDKGDNFIGIIKPNITVGLIGNLSVGFEHMIYFSDRYIPDLQAIHDVRTEERLFLRLYLQDSERKDHYE